jgi:hypothetical protein
VGGAVSFASMPNAASAFWLNIAKQTPAAVNALRLLIFDSDISDEPPVSTRAMRQRYGSASR